MINFDQLTELVKRNRSYRRFDENEKITNEQLVRWTGLARFTASGRNMQPLKYALVTSETSGIKIFEQLAWAGYLKEWNGPAPGERPVAYVVVMKDRLLSENIYCDDGIAVQTIMLAAVSEGFGGCVIGSFNKAKISTILNLHDHLDVLWVLALGKPSEKVVIEELEGADIRYWRDEANVHHVPKRKLTDLIVREI